MTRRFRWCCFTFFRPVGQPLVAWPTATDLSGNVIWYYPGELLLTRTEVGGNFFSLSNILLQEYDLAGNETLETNLEILNEQLVPRVIR